MRNILLGAIYLLLTACSEAPPALQPLSGDAVILAFGDSLTYGTGVNKAQSYPARLQQLTGRRVINAGVPGEISAQGIQRLPKLLERHQPELVILIHGGNDFLRKLPAEQTRRHLQQMIKQIRQADSQVLLVAVPRPGLLLADAPLYQRVAEQDKVPLLQDLLADILQNSSTKSDLIHPNAEGYALLAEGIHAFLQEAGALP